MPLPCTTPDSGHPDAPANGLPFCNTQYFEVLWMSLFPMGRTCPLRPLCPLTPPTLDKRAYVADLAPPMICLDRGAWEGTLACSGSRHVRLPCPFHDANKSSNAGQCDISPSYREVNAISGTNATAPMGKWRWVMDLIYN